MEPNQNDKVNPILVEKQNDGQPQQQPQQGGYQPPQPGQQVQYQQQPGQQVMYQQQPGQQVMYQQQPGQQMYQQPVMMQPGMQMQPGMVMQPGQQMQGMYVQPQPIFVPANPLDILAPHKKIQIRQKVELFEAMTGFETCNKYMIYDEDKDKKLFFAKEKSECCQRQFCGSRRAFKMALMPHTGVSDWKDTDNACMTMERPFKCTWMCFNRPRIFIKKCKPEDTETTEPMGTIFSPFRCCDMDYEVLDDKENVIYHLSGSKCQPGMWCKCPFAPFNKIEYEIRDAHNTECLGMVTKEWSGCGKELFTDADNFSVDFPNKATSEHKAFILAAVLLIDFMYFEQSGNNRRNR
eukprot:TRINITY_DN781983_c0_g1_i1.p1 TRINITY_DN781983_c0_g1~~TRINITY_DN781983_c0_g1_i1.p1  ORF type:complete len:350 (+),score=111.77 TRINITY_DN781983_c0_g1_i1:125-1174(+)